MKILEFIRFEFQYRKGRPATYIYFLLMMLLGFAVSLAAQKVFNVPGLVKLNAPSIIDQMFGMSILFAMIVISALTGVSVMRDYQQNTYTLFLTHPIKKSEYLLGRFIGSFLIVILIYTGAMLGMAIPEIFKINPNLSYNPFVPGLYLRSFIFVALPNIFFLSALFFAGGAISKKSTIVYLNGILVFLFFSIMDETLVSFLPNRDTAALLDFFLIQAINEKTEFWSIAEQNSNLVPHTGVLLINRLILISMGTLILISTVKSFRINPRQKAKK